MSVLVSAASRHGATAEIAEAIDRTLRGRGIETDLRAPAEVADLAGYHAVVLGSAVYMGRWLEEARRLVEEHAALLAARPVWLFSSGPVGDPLKPDEDPVDVADVVTSTGARGHRVFPGRIDRGRLRFAEKAVVLALRVPDGDFRDWAAIEDWANGIADDLAAG